MSNTSLLLQNNSHEIVNIGAHEIMKRNSREMALQSFGINPHSLATIQAGTREIARQSRKRREMQLFTGKNIYT